MGEDNVTQIVARAAALVDAKRPEEAVRVLSEYSGLAEDAVALSALGHASLAAGNIAKSQDALHASIALDPHDYYPWMLLSMVQRRLSKFNDAHQSASQALRLEPNSVEAHAEISAVHREVGQLGAAMNHANLAVSIDGNSEIAWLALARTQIAGQDFVSAQLTAQQILKISPMSTQAKLLRGVSQYGNEDREAAYESLVDAIRADPSDAAVRDILLFLARPERVYVPPIVRILAIVTGLAFFMFAIWIFVILVRWLQVPRDVRKLVWSNSAGRKRVALLYAGVVVVPAILLIGVVAIFLESA